MQEHYFNVGTYQGPTSCAVNAYNNASYQLPLMTLLSLATAGYIDLKHSDANAVTIRHECPTWVHRASNCLVIEDGDRRLIFGRTPEGPNLLDYGANQGAQVGDLQGVYVRL